MGEFVFWSNYVYLMPQSLEGLYQIHPEIEHIPGRVDYDGNFHSGLD
jgi:hypothetical protein